MAISALAARTSIWAEYRVHHDLRQLSILGDWCADHDFADDAFLYHWCARKGKRPGRRTKSQTGRTVQERFAWAWWPERRAIECGDPHVLPTLVYAGLPRTAQGAADHIYFASEVRALFELRRSLLAGREQFSVS